MKNYLGLENREPDTPTFGSQIRDHFADLNDNGVYDVYDYSFTMAGLDGGTKQKGQGRRFARGDSEQDRGRGR